MESHGAVASKAYGDDALVRSALNDWRSAPFTPKVRTALGFLEKLTLAPDTVGPDDILAMRRAGVSDAAIEDAIHVCALFSVYVRLADSFEFEIPDAASFEMGAKMLLERGYA